MSPVTAAEIDAAATATLRAASVRRARAARLSLDTQNLLAEIDEILHPVAPEFAETLVSSLQSAVTTLRDVIAGDDPTGDELAGLRRFLFDIERPPVPREWHLDRDSRPGDVPDLTTAPWPRVCQERTTTTDHDVRHTYTCTRLIGHSGRHAAGDSRYIVAVWEQAEPEALGAVEEAA